MRNATRPVIIRNGAVRLRDWMQRHHVTSLASMAAAYGAATVHGVSSSVNTPFNTLQDFAEYAATTTDLDPVAVFDVTRSHERFKAAEKVVWSVGGGGGDVDGDDDSSSPSSSSSFSSFLSASSFSSSSSFSSASVGTAESNQQLKEEAQAAAHGVPASRSKDFGRLFYMEDLSLIHI